jgi:hypothetical protein
LGRLKLRIPDARGGGCGTVSLMIALPIGTGYQATIFDHAATTFAFIGFSVTFSRVRAQHPEREAAVAAVHLRLHLQVRDPPARRPDQTVDHADRRWPCFSGYLRALYARVHVKKSASDYVAPPVAKGVGEASASIVTSSATADSRGHADCPQRANGLFRVRRSPNRFSACQGLRAADHLDPEQRHPAIKAITFTFSFLVVQRHRRRDVRVLDPRIRYD